MTTSAPDDIAVNLRIDFSREERLGRGKIMLLSRIIETGSISAAGRSMDMSYRRAWLLIDELNRTFRKPLVETQKGGGGGGGAQLTPFGNEVVRLYRAIGADATQATMGHLQSLQRMRTPGR